MQKSRATNLGFSPHFTLAGLTIETCCVAGLALFLQILHTAFAFWFSRQQSPHPIIQPDSPDFRFCAPQDLDRPGILMLLLN
jgi:hypothetical protein